MKPCPFCRAAVSDDVVFAPGAQFCGACGRNGAQVSQAPTLPPGAAPFTGEVPGQPGVGGQTPWPAQPGQTPWPTPGNPQQTPWPPQGGPQVGQQPWPPPGGPQVGGPQVGGPQVGGPQYGGPQVGGPQVGGQQPWMGMPTNPNVAGAQTGPTGLNWGAFLIPFIWGPANNVWIGLVGLVGFFAGGGTGLGLLCGAISLGISIYLLIKGNDLAWRSGKVWQSGAQFQAVQKQWVIWGLVAVAVEFVVGLLLGMMALQRAQYVPQYPPQYPSGQ